MSFPYICISRGYNEANVYVNEFVTFETQREYSVLIKASMITNRSFHNSVFNKGFLYKRSAVNMRFKVMTKVGLRNCLSIETKRVKYF